MHESDGAFSEKKKISKKMSDEKKWDFCGRVTEKQSLIEELVPKAESPSKQRFKDNETAEDIREKAIERLEERRQETPAIQRKVELLQNVIEPLVDLKLRAKQQEQESQQNDSAGTNK